MLINCISIIVVFSAIKGSFFNKTGGVYCISFLIMVNKLDLYNRDKY